MSFKAEPIEQTRPESVSDSAIWAGGLDGGAWIEKVEYSNSRFSYRIYSDNGDIWAIGDFVYCHLNQIEPKYSPVDIDSIPEIFHYSSFDGTFIRFTNYDYILVPDSWILFPLMDSTYKKQLFELGIERSEEIQFDSIPISELE